MNDNKEVAQRIIDRYITILGILPVVLFSSQISNLKLNSKGKVTSITDDKVTLLKFINAIEPFSGKYIKNSVVKKFLSDYDSSKEIVWK